jgi:hypothetical protein
MASLAARAEAIAARRLTVSRSGCPDGRLRRKLGDPPVILTTPGIGYRIG